MSDFQLLKAIAGFEDAWEAKDALAQGGTDFSEQRGAVRNAVAQLHPKRLQLTVLAVFEDTPSTRTLRLAPREGGVLPPFQAGQYINLFVNIDGVATARPYAISSPATQRDYYDVTVKRAVGGYVSHFLLDRLGVGANLTSSGPMGTFHHNPIFHGVDLVFLAGGSGSAPARSMILDMLDRQLPFSFHLIYVNSFVEDVIYAEELRELAANHPNFRLTEIISRPPEGYTGLSGRLTAERLRGLLGEDAEVLVKKMYYICGPTPFNDHCIDLLNGLGVPGRRIRVEANGAPKRPDEQPHWPEGVSLDDEVTVTVQGRGSFKTRVGEPLLNSLERHGYGAENACRSGECSLCRVKVVRGQVFNPVEAHLRKSDREFGWVYACVAFPVGDVEILN